MKKFETLSELDILNLAYFELLRKWDNEREKNDETIRLVGHDNIIAQHHMSRYKAQMQELHAEICRLENKKS